MKRAVIAGGAFVIVLVLLALAARHRARERDVAPPDATSPAIPPSAAAPAEGTQQGFLYGRITAQGGATYGDGCAGEATRRRFGATTSTATRRKTPGASRCRPSGCPRSTARSRSSGS